MKKFALLFCIVALMMAACDKEEHALSSEQPGTSQTDTIHPAPAQNYPATAEVIYDAVTDVEGNIYDAVRIGDQIWMASNLRTSHFANGEEVPEGGTYLSFTQPYRYKPSDDVALYGYLYNWPAVMHGEEASNTNPSGVQGICPQGWHIPSRAEWEQLNFYCSTHSECFCNESSENVAKSIAADHTWRHSSKSCVVGNDLNSNNITGFSALPAGVFSFLDYPEEGGAYWRFGELTNYCSSSEYNDNNAYVMAISYDNKELYAGYLNAKNCGQSVRCLKD